MSEHAHVHCNDMKVGEVYSCPACGLELKVVKSCNHEGQNECCASCADDSSGDGFSCCGEPMVKKQ